jgi:type II secretory pathway component PulJ
VLVVVSLLSLIVLALMAVFNSTQRAFRASITQTDVLEGGRATMD